MTDKTELLREVLIEPGRVAPAGLKPRQPPGNQALTAQSGATVDDPVLRSTRLEGPAGGNLAGVPAVDM